MTTPTPEQSAAQQAEQQVAQGQATQAVAAETGTAQPNGEAMTAQGFRDWMDALPDKIADALDVKFGERTAARNAGGQQQTQQVAATEDKKTGGFFGTGKSFAEWWTS